MTSRDFAYAFERLANPKDGAQYAFYYSAIKGFDAYAKGKAKTIAGITTPNPSTIVFHLTPPTGDFLYRLGMPATGAIPMRSCAASTASPASTAATSSPRAPT